MPGKPGPKTELEPHIRTKNCSFTLDDRTITLLDVLGCGNKSLGLRYAAEIAYERYQQTGVRAKNPPAP